jgi:transposase
LDHLAFFINDVFEEIDISEIQRVYEIELRGYSPSHPKMMLKILIYGNCTGVQRESGEEKGTGREKSRMDI